MPCFEPVMTMEEGFPSDAFCFTSGRKVETPFTMPLTFVA